MKAINTLLNSYDHKKVGNHSLEIKSNGSRAYLYYNTVICRAFPSFKKAVIMDGGFKTSSTTRAINVYVRHFKDLGYEIIDQR